MQRKSRFFEGVSQRIIKLIGVMIDVVIGNHAHFNVVSAHLLDQI